jgi:hypothetical protein
MRRRLQNILNTVIKNRRLLILLLLVIAVGVTYLPALFNNFILRWDDQWVVVNHYTYGGFTADNLWKVLTEFYHGQYSPVNQLYYILLYSINGFDPFVFHLGSLLLHLVNVILVCFLFSKILLSSGSFNKNDSVYLSFFTALLFAVHPFNVESAAWLSASKVLVYSVFYLLAMIAYVRYINSRKLKYYIFSLFLFVISFGGKEQAVTLPLILILLDYVLCRDLRNKRLWLEKLPFFLISLAGGILTIYSQGNSLNGDSYPFYQRIVFAAYTLTEYFTKCVFPVNLLYLYPFPNQQGETLPVKMWIYPAALFILFLMAVKYKMQKHKWICFLSLYFTAHLLITLHLISLSRFAIIADRYVYMASPAVFLGVGILLLQLVKRFARYKRLLFLSAGIYIILLGTYSHERSKVWHDTDSLKKELREKLELRKER